MRSNFFLTEDAVILFNSSVLVEYHLICNLTGFKRITEDHRICFGGRGGSLVIAGFLQEGKICSMVVHQFGYLEQWEIVEKRRLFFQVSHVGVSMATQIEKVTSSVSSLLLLPSFLWQKEWRSCPMTSRQSPCADSSSASLLFIYV